MASASVWIGTAQFLIGAAIACWASAKIDDFDTARRYRRIERSEKTRMWSIALSGFALAIFSPVTVLLVRF